MEYTSFFLSATIVALAALYIYKSEPRIAEQEQTVLLVTEHVKELQNQIKEMSTKYTAENGKLRSILEEELLKVSREITELKATKTEKQQMDSTKNDIYQIQSKIEEKGVTYVRWGKTACDGVNTETVYRGQVGGGRYTHKGASVNHICLPNDPEAAKPLQSHDHYAYLYGAEYQLFAYNKPEGIKSGISNHDVACAVCMAKGKTTTLMIPGRKSCYEGWKKEYNGYLMAGYHSHEASSEYACVDKDTEAMPGGANDESGVLFYPVKTQCGSLKCPPYTGNTEVLCVVCTK